MKNLKQYSAVEKEQNLSKHCDNGQLKTVRTQATTTIIVEGIEIRKFM